MAVGTNALIQPGVHYRRLGLAVTDEQHRFGVIQRAALVNKSTEEDAAGPQTHTLVMSATPIPRTLSLILYGDLDVSVLDEMPPGRMKVDTFLVDGSYRARIEAFIRKQLDAGRRRLSSARWSRKTASRTTRRPSPSTPNASARRSRPMRSAASTDGRSQRRRIG